MDERPLMRALRGEALPVPPVWLMRQAGRYLPEYRAVRERAGSFLDLCYTPELAAEVTLQPIRRFGFDAAILFADILLVPHALGANLVFVEGEGPRLSTVTGPEDLARLKPAEAAQETLAPVYQTVRLVRAALPPEVPLIGFAGAPWTVAKIVRPCASAERTWSSNQPQLYEVLHGSVASGGGPAFATERHVRTSRTKVAPLAFVRAKAVSRTVGGPA